MATRTLTDTATIAWGEATPNQVKGNVVDDSVTNALLANVPTATFKGRVTAATGDPEDMTPTQAASLLDSFFLTPTEGNVAYLSRVVVGAIGNGIANDTAAFSAAFNAGGFVFVPPGTYLIDPIDIANSVHIIMHPDAVLKRRSVTANVGSHSCLLDFTTGSDGSVIEGGTIDGNKATFGASYADINVQWPAILFQLANRLTVRHVEFTNHVNWAVWVGSGNGHMLSDLFIKDSGKAIIFQFTDNSTCRDIVAENISNNGIAMYQHAFEFRVMNGCTIDNIRLNGYTPDGLGVDPFPIAFAVERSVNCKVSGLFLTGFAGTETRNYGGQFSNCQDTSFSDIHFDNTFWGIELGTGHNCTLTGWTVHGGFKTHALHDGFGLGLRSHGVFQPDSTQAAFDTRANAECKQVTVSNGSAIGCEVGVACYSAGILISNVIANANAFYGFQIREAGDNASWFPGQPIQKVENVCLSNCQARFNGFSGVLLEAGDQTIIDGGIYSDNGWDTSLGALFRAGILIAELLGADSVEHTSVSNIYCGDTQTFTKTDGASFRPGSTVANRFTLSFIDPDQIAVGQYVSLINATGVGNVTARVVELNLDEAVVETSGPVTFSETGNLTSLTGTLSSAGNVVTGVGTLFTTEIRGTAWIKVSGNYYRVHRVNSNTECIIFPIPGVAFSGSAAQIISIDVQGIPSQQYGVVTGNTVGGPVALSGINADGAVTGVASIGAESSLDLAGADSIHSSGGLFSFGGSARLLGPDLGQNIQFVNGGLVASVGASALTIAIKTLAGTDPSLTQPVHVIFRSATAATGAYSRITLTAATSFVVSSGSTLGTVNSTAFRLWIVGFNDAGTFRLGIINCLSGANIFPLAGFGIASATAEGGAGAADSAHVFYAGAAVSAKAYTVLGYASFESGLGTAGTWSAVPTRLQLYGAGVKLPGDLVQRVRTATGATASGTTLIPIDDTIPQIGEGDEYMTQAITPTSTANALNVSARAILSHSVAATHIIAALFQDATANALIAADDVVSGAAAVLPLDLRHVMLAATAAATTFRVRAGGSQAGITRFNGNVATRLLGGVMNSYMEIEEIMA